MIYKLIRSYYKNFINPLFPNTCIYTPSCSAYFGQAIQKYGAVVGSSMGIKRVCRCVPWKNGGFEPVKDNFKGKAKWLI